MTGSADTDPANYSYASPPLESGVCYPSGQTPSQLLVMFSGIIPGDTPSSNFLGYHNSAFILTVSTPDVWIFSDANRTITLSNGSSPSTLVFTNSAGETHFTDSKAGTCHTTFANQLVTPATDTWIKGFAVISPLLPSAKEYIPDSMAALNIPQQEGMFANGSPLDESEAVFRYTDGTDATNLSVKFDTP